jgi:hypothetical protein
VSFCRDGGRIWGSRAAAQDWYRRGMSQTTPDQTQTSSNAERLRVAMGWERLPEMSPEQREIFDAEQRRFDEEIRRFYADPAA